VLLHLDFEVKPVEGVVGHPLQVPDCVHSLSLTKPTLLSIVQCTVCTPCIDQTEGLFSCSELSSFRKSLCLLFQAQFSTAKRNLYTVKKVTDFLVPSREPFTKLALRWNDIIIPGIESLVIGIPAGDGNAATFFTVYKF
jgi:hypothetical protein